MTNPTQDNTGGDGATHIGAAWMREQAALVITRYAALEDAGYGTTLSEVIAAIRAIPLPTNADLLAEAMKLPDVAALVEAALDGNELAHGVSFMKSKIIAEWGYRVESKLLTALAPFTAAKETP